MAGRQLDVSVIVRMVDRLSNPLAGLHRQLTRVADMGRRLGAVGAIAAGISFAVPLQSAAAFDAQLRDIAITAGKTGAAVDQSVRRSTLEYHRLALQVGQSSEALARGAGLLIASGLDATLVDKLLPTVGKVTTAANAQIEDVAKTAFALTDTLKIPADRLELAFAGLIVAGKAGRFELKNMASEFPALTAQMAKLGIFGMEAVKTLGAGLQVAMKGAGSTADAANNYKNFLAKIAAPETLKKFKEQGVDLIGVMQNAAVKGINPVEAVVQKIGVMTGVSAKEVSAVYERAKKGGASDLQAMQEVRAQIEKIGGAAKLGNLFGDIQVLDFLLPMLANIEEYKRIRDSIGAADTKVIEDDFWSRMNGPEKRLERLVELGTQATRGIGEAFGKNLPLISDGIDTLLQNVAAVYAAWPGLIDGALSFGGAALLLVAGLALLGPVAGAVGAGFGIVAAAAGLLITPVGAVVLLLASAVPMIMRDLRTFRSFFERILDGVQDAFLGFWRWLKGLFTGDMAGAAEGLRVFMRGLNNVARGGLDILETMFWTALRAVDDMLGADLAGWVRKIETGLNEIEGAIRSFSLVEAGKALLQSLWDGLVAKWDALKAWLGGLGASIGDAIRGAGGPAAAPGTATGVDPMGNPTGFEPPVPAAPAVDPTGPASDLDRLRGEAAASRLRIEELRRRLQPSPATDALGNPTGHATPLSSINPAIAPPGTPTVRAVPVGGRSFAPSVPQVAATPASYGARVEGVESGGNPNARARTSSATGLHQFIASTWRSWFPRVYPQEASRLSDRQELALRTNADVSRRVFTAFSEFNARGLAKAGLPVTDGNRYLAHFAGLGGATKLLTADPATPARDVLDPRALRANRFLRGKTAGEVVEWADRKMRGRRGPDEAGGFAPVGSHRRGQDQAGGFAPMGGARTNNQVTGRITVAVEGPGKVTSVQSDNPKVALTPDRGAVVGRA